MRICLFWLLVGAGMFPILAQENRAAILGRITDPTGAVVVGARVVAVNLKTGIETAGATNEQGNYLIRSLPPGSYHVQAESQGFKRARVSELVLQIQQQARLDFALELGDVAETVSVSAQAPLLSTDDTTLGQVVETKKILELPVSDRNLAQLSLLGAGVSTSTNGISRVLSGILTGGVALTANGMRDSTNQFSVDGANINVGFYNYPTFVPVVDAVQEFKVRTGNYSAEYGGFGGAQVDYVLKSGTNEFHGALWEFFRNDALDARNAFSSGRKPVLRQNQFGGMVSGPLIRNRTFFMTTYQGLRRRGQTILQGTVPTEAHRSGDLSRKAGGALEGPIIDPANGQPFAGNRIPVSRMSGTTGKVLGFYPLPNQAGGVNYRVQSSVPRDEDAVLAKVDHMFGNSNRLTVRYVFQETENLNRVPLIADFGTTAPTRSQNVAVLDTHTLSPTTLLDFRLSWNRLLLRELTPRNGSDIDVRQTLNMRIPSTIGPGSIENNFPFFQITGIAPVGDSSVTPLVQPDENYQVVGSASMLRGKHSLRFGAELRRTRSGRFHGRFTSGRLQFQPGNPAGSGHAFADFLLGLPRTSDITLEPSVVDIRQTMTHLYLADVWSVTPRLTLDLGLRYEINVPMSETYGRIPVFDFTAPGSFSTLAGGEGFFQSDYNNFAPRVGLAYRPWSRTVVRAAYGLFYSEPKKLGLNVKSINPPFLVSQAFFASRENPLTASNPFPIGLAAAGGVPAPNSFQFNRQTPYVQTWSLNVQRQFGNSLVLDAGYVGNHAIKMGRQMQLNVPLEPGPGAIQARRPLPLWGRANHTQYDSNSNYSGLQVRLEKRFSSGFSLLGAYTYSRTTDLSGDELTGGTIDPRDLNRDRGLSEAHLKNRLSVSYVWELPFGLGKPWLNRGGVSNQLLGGWQLSGVTVFQSGRALTVTAPGDRANAGLGTRPNRICDGNLDAGGTAGAWFDTGCFVLPPQFSFGNSGRGVIIGPGFQGWDVGIMKRFRITESNYLQFRAELFNAFNHVNYGDPGTTLATPAFGRITSAGDARGVQFGLKYAF